jgi:glyoxylase-like metal-dependent hydrolase (beta-lactamase superfamily II)
MVINTHTHFDHTSGQLEFPGSIEVVAHENTRTNMLKIEDYKKPENAKVLPKRTFKDRLSVGSGSDRIDLYYFGPGHTNGDAWIAFPAQRVVHAGDIFAGKQVPLMDMDNGGSGVAYPDTLMKAYKGISKVDAHNRRTPPARWQMPYTRSAFAQRSATIPMSPGIKSEPMPIVA